MKKNVVFGTGLIGGYLAASLSENKIDVSIIGRAAITEQLNQGATFSRYNNYETSCVLPNYQAGEIDILWITLKATQIATAISTIKSIISPHTLLITCQNGLETHQEIQKALPSHSVLRAMVQFNVIRKTPKHYHCSTDGKLFIEQSEASQSLIGMMNSKLVRVAATKDIEAIQWAKLQLNMVNGLNALAQVPLLEMLKDRGFRCILARLQKELLNTAKAKHLTLPKLTPVRPHFLPYILQLPNVLYLSIAAKTLTIDPTAMTSMYWDLSAKRKTEIDTLNVALIREAEELGVPCPTNQRLVDLIHQLESNPNEPIPEHAALKQLFNTDQSR